MGSYIDEFEGEHQRESEIIVTVDGTSGAGKGTLGKQIAEMLGVPHYSAGDFFRSIASDRDMTVEELSEKADKETDVEVDRRTLEKGLSESCVIDGRLPSRVLGDYSDLRVFLTADLEERARRIAGREDISFEDAKERTEQRDRDNDRRYSEYYGIDTDDLEIYDLVIDNTDLEMDEQRELVEKVLRQRFPDKFREEKK